MVAESGYNIKPDIGGGHIERGGVEVFREDFFCVSHILGEPGG